MSDKPNIFEYIDFRKYLKDWREAAKRSNPGLTHEYLCSKLGQKTRGYFNDLEKGRRTIGPDVLDRLVKLLSLNSTEAKYFRAIVGYGQPTTYEEREYWFEQAVQLNNTPKKLVDRKTYAYYKNWYYATVRAYLETCDFTNEYARASRALYGRISPQQVKEAIENLLQLGLIAPDKKGFLKPTDKVITTGEVVKDELLKRYQIANHDVLRTILEEDNPENHNSSQIIISVSSEAAKRIGKRLQQFRAEVLSIAHKDERKTERVYRIALHAYPESRKV